MGRSELQNNAMAQLTIDHPFRRGKSCFDPSWFYQNVIIVVHVMVVHTSMGNLLHVAVASTLTPTSVESCHKDV